ncbi:MAG: hypothetical protein LIP23_10390 [Planctomycetes bacterium]|nr:hypothetical protein [Planctomycetota bacterium]
MAKTVYKMKTPQEKETGRSKALPDWFSNSPRHDGVYAQTLFTLFGFSLFLILTESVTCDAPVYLSARAMQTAGKGFFTGNYWFFRSFHHRWRKILVNNRFRDNNMGRAWESACLDG